MAKKKETGSDATTEEKIREAARKVFTQKGYAATRTRDIAEEAGMNLALLNYYFRSKEKLFEIVMAEKVQQLFGLLYPILNDPASSLEKKTEQIVSQYMDMLMENPDLPLFVLSEIKNNPEQFGNKMQVSKLLKESVFVKQIHEKRPDLNPLHFIINLLGLTVFPFIAKPVFQSAGEIDQKAFKTLINERRVLIPVWIKAMLKTK